MHVVADCLVVSRPNEIDVAKSALEATKEQLGVSQADNQRVQSLKDYSVVTAPFTGVITMRYADVACYPGQKEDLKILAALEGGKVKPLFPRIG